MMARELLLSAPDLQAKMDRLALEIFENRPQTRRLALVGIHRGGVPMARRVAENLRQRGVDCDLGSLDISLYRDDLGQIRQVPLLIGSDIPFEVDGAHLILLDDVLFTGRTIRAAIDALTDYGRPAKIELAVLIDRGNRELPIQADYLGMEVVTEMQDKVAVSLNEIDGKDLAELIRN